jgi:hypothetical protein
MLSMQVFSGNKTSGKKYVIASLGLAVVVFLTRILPISFGVHTFILLAIYIGIGYYYLGIKINKTILAALASIVLLSAADLANVFLLINIGGIPMETILNEESLKRILYGMPSLAIFLMIVLVYSKFISRRKKNR